jgi:hypothetical protein
MADLSHYLESGLINHVFRGETFAKVPNICIALCSGVPANDNDGSTIPELEEIYTDGGRSSGYKRIDLNDPALSGNVNWKFDQETFEASGGVIKNCFVIDWPTAQFKSDDTDENYGWGWVSGLAILDSNQVGEGNLLMQAQLDNPREVFGGDTLRFDAEALIIRFN